MTSAIGVIFVNHHSEGLIAPRAARLLGDGLTVVVVDNSGTYGGDGIVVPAGGNLGFGAACNLGEKTLPDGTSRICLHNPDVDATAATIRRLAEMLDDVRHPGAIAPVVRDARVVRPAGYRYPSIRREAILAAGIRRPNGAGTAPSTGERFGTAAMLMIDRGAWNDVDGFDERYFLYAEDLDFWHRLRVAERHVGFTGELSVVHHQATGSRLGDAHRELLRWVGVELFAESSGRLDWRALRRIHRIALRRYHSSAPVLVEAITTEWRRGATPGTVAEVLRPGLVDGSLLRPSLEFA